MKSLLASLLFLIVSLSTAAGQTDKRIAKNPKINYDWQPGFVNITELTEGLGLNLTYVPYSRNYFGITTVNGYQFSRNIKAGVGVGAHIYGDGVLVPVYVDARFNLNAQEYVPFISAAGGAELSLSNLNETSRIFINPAVGLKWVAANRLGVSFASGVMVMSGSKGRSSFVNFRLGVEFKGK